MQAGDKVSHVTRLDFSNGTVISVGDDEARVEWEFEDERPIRLSHKIWNLKVKT